MTVVSVADSELDPMGIEELSVADSGLVEKIVVPLLDGVSVVEYVEDVSKVVVPELR